MNFSKIQAAGNDFVVIDARKLEADWPSMACDMCDRHFGAGADGIILVCDSDSADFRMRIFNADGSEAEACGNGLRSFAKYVLDRELTGNSTFTIATMAGTRKVEAFFENGFVKKVKTSMGMPTLNADEIPVLLEKAYRNRGGVDIMSLLESDIVLEGMTVTVSMVSMGNPHAVAFTEGDVYRYDLEKIGPLIEHNSIFPRRTNFEVIHITNRNEVKARVWERGVGETLACGSGACAIAVVTILKGYTDNKVDIMLPGGTLSIEWDGVGEVFLTGPVEAVYEGVWPD